MITTAAVVARTATPRGVAVTIVRGLRAEVFLEQGEAVSDMFAALICRQAETGPLPPDNETLRGIVGATPDVWSRSQAGVLKWFRRDCFGRFYNPLIELLRWYSGGDLRWIPGDCSNWFPHDLKGVEK